MDIKDARTFTRFDRQAKTDRQQMDMEMIAGGLYPGGRNFPGYSAFEPDVACPYNHKDLAPFSVNAASREQAATVNLIKYKRD